MTSTTDSFSYSSVAVIWILLYMITLYLVWFYSSKKTSWLIIIIASFGWLIPASVVLLLPLDLTSAMYYDCKQSLEELRQHPPFTPNISNDTNTTNTSAIYGAADIGMKMIVTSLSDAVISAASSVNATCDPPALYVSSQFLVVSWQAVYWVMFIMLLLFIPFFQAYIDSGYFTKIEKAKKSLRVNFLNYVAMGIVGIGIIIYLAATGQLKNIFGLLGISMALLNMFNLTYAVVLMSFGFVQIPRSFWHLGNRKRTLRVLEYQATQIKDSLNDADAELDELTKEIQSVNRRVRFHDDLRAYVDVVLDNLGQNGETHSADESRTETSMDSDVTVLSLAQLNKNIIRAVRKKERYQYEWDSTCQRAFLLQDIISQQNSNTWKFTSTAKPIKSKLTLFNYELDLSQFRGFFEIIDYVWLIKVAPVFYRSVGVLFGIMSIIVIWANVTYAITINNTPISIIGNLYQAEDASYSTVQFVSLAFLAYMCLCSLNSIFRIKLFSAFSIHPYHHSSDTSILWISGLMCRLGFPLSFIFVNMCSGKTNNTAFGVFMKNMDIAPLIGSGAQAYFPILISVICVLDIFDVLGRVSKCLGLQEDFLDNKDSDGSWGNAEDGKILIADARVTYERRIGDPNYEAGRRNSVAGLLHDKSSSGVSYGSKREPNEKKEFTSNYILNNPLYEKYRNKGTGSNRHELNSIKTDEQTGSSSRATKNPVKPAAHASSHVGTEYAGIGSRKDKGKEDAKGLLDEDEDDKGFAGFTSSIFGKSNK